MTTAMSLNEAREKLGTLAGLPVTTIEAAKILAALGITVQPEKPEPGLYRYGGEAILIDPQHDWHIFVPSEGTFIYMDDGDHDKLTPARVVPAEPPVLTEEEVRRIYNGAAHSGSFTFEEDVFEDIPGLNENGRLAVTATVNAAIAKHGGARELPGRGTITIPRPHVPFGPKGITEDQADADYLREAARKMKARPPFGSNLTATIVKLLSDTADALRGGGDDD